MLFFFLVLYKKKVGGKILSNKPSRFLSTEQPLPAVSKHGAPLKAKLE